MHDGSLNSLNDVIDHYVQGGQGHNAQDELISGFQLSEQEREDLVAFLRSLTDEEFLNNPSFKPED